MSSSHIESLAPQEPAQPDFFSAEADTETAAAHSVLGQLFTDSRLYTQSKDYKELLDFVVRLRNFAPFNAMLLQVQKPGLQYAASARDWLDRFGREPKEDARPLLIMWPFGPVALVYDLTDTEGEPLPEHVYAFPAKGNMTPEKILGFVANLHASRFSTTFIDAGDRKAGSIERRILVSDPKVKPEYSIKINKNHDPNVQLATLTHELAHLCLGHLGPDKSLRIPGRLNLNHEQREIEAESVAYLICCRNGVASRSEAYLAAYVQQHTTIDQLDLYQVMRAAGAVERMLGLNPHIHV
jgi:hypothetical protein